MQVTWSAPRMVSFHVRLMHAARGLRGVRPVRPPPFHPRAGTRVVAHLRAWRDAGLSLREVAAVELGVGEEDYTMWEIRSTYDESFLADALRWGDHGLLVQRWFDVGDALERERRRRQRRGVVRDRIVDRLMWAARGLQQLFRPAVQPA